MRKQGARRDETQGRGSRRLRREFGEEKRAKRKGRTIEGLRTGQKEDERQQEQIICKEIVKKLSTERKESEIYREELYKKELTDVAWYVEAFINESLSHQVDFAIFSVKASMESDGYELWL